MNREDLLSAFSSLEDGLIERSEAHKPRASRQKWAGLAACLILLAGTVFLTRGLWRPWIAPEAQGHEIGKASVPEGSAQGPGHVSAPGENRESDDMISFQPPAERPAPALIRGYQTEEEAEVLLPRNGEVLFSAALRGAMAQYGDDVRYQVILDLFLDEAQLPAEKPGEAVREELQRLKDRGYWCSRLRFFEGGELKAAYFSFTGTRRELEAFSAAAGDFGYLFSLYGERVGSYASDTVIFVERPADRDPPAHKEEGYVWVEGDSTPPATPRPPES